MRQNAFWAALYNCKNFLISVFSVCFVAGTKFIVPLLEMITIEFNMLQFCSQRSEVVLSLFCG
jgi:hypothetical protein